MCVSCSTRSALRSVSCAFCCGAQERVAGAALRARDQAQRCGDRVLRRYDSSNAQAISMPAIFSCSYLCTAWMARFSSVINNTESMVDRGASTTRLCC